MALEQSDTFIMRTGSGKWHLHFVISYPARNGDIAIASISSCKSEGKYDNACVFLPEELSYARKSSICPYMNKKSFVYYEKARILKLRETEEMIEDNRLIVQNPAKPEDFSRIIEGFRKSRETPKEVLFFLRRHNLI